MTFGGQISDEVSKNYSAFFTALTRSTESMKLFKSEHSENNSKSDKKSLQMANTCVCERT